MFSFLRLFLRFGGDGILRPRASSSPPKVKQKIRPKHFPPRSPLAKRFVPQKSSWPSRVMVFVFWLTTANPVKMLRFLLGWQFGPIFLFRSCCQFQAPRYSLSHPFQPAELLTKSPTEANASQSVCDLIQVETPQILDFNRRSWLGVDRDDFWEGQIWLSWV